MALTLGLDIGSNSVGWALVDEDDGRLLGMGVRVFPEGVDRDKQGGELSKNEDRRVARGMRRQIARRARRKAALRSALVAAGLYPSDPEAQATLDAADPYELRARALTDRLEPHQIGRVLIHLNQRRGFLSNRKSDRAKKKEASETLAEISALAGALGGHTVGQHFAALRKNDHHRRIRGQHTHRDMFVDEFNRIWEAQRAFHPGLLTDALRHGARGERAYPVKPEPLGARPARSPLSEFGIHGILFFQRAMYWPRSVVGRCELEPDRKRCPRADRRAQRFRVLQEVNNIRITENSGLERPLRPDERATLLGLLSASKDVPFEKIRASLALPEGTGINLERGDRKKLDGLKTDVTLAGKNYFGKKEWAALPEARKDAIVRSVIEDDEKTLIEKATRDWGCTEELARRLADLDLEGGYSAYSVEAIEKLLPHLERGLKVMGKDAGDSALHAAGYLRPDERAVGQVDSLPLPPDGINNPLVRQALFEVRKVVNAVIREWGKPDAIHIELAREVQGGAKRRREQIERMREREARRAEAAEAIRALGSKPSRDAIERFLLWKEQGERCLYSGKTISAAQLLGGEVQVDHILPYSRSLDNSLANKAVCFRDENDRKGNRTVAEWLKEADAAKYEAILQRARRLPLDVRDAKTRKIAATEVVRDDFLNRQLSDTAYITTQVRAYVQRLGTDIVCVKGQATAELRHVWGLDSVLRSDDLKLKNRDDHRHHAVDALVIALTTRSRLQQLATLRHLKTENPRFAPRPGTPERLFPRPWESFDADVRAAVEAILVSHRPRRGIAGALHEETLYGPTSKPHRETGHPRPHARDWIEEDGIFVLRKPLESLTAAEVGKIRDPQVRRLVVERLRAHGIDPDAKNAKIPRSVWAEPLRMVGRGGAEKSPNATIIRRVRITKDDQTIRPIRQGERTAHVKPGNTHHIALFELPGSTPEKPRRVMKAITMLEAAERARRGEPLIQRVHPEHPEARFLFSLSWGESVLADIRGARGVYTYRTAASTQGQIYFVSNHDARPSKTATKFAVNANTLNGEKIHIDPLGRMRRAQD